MFTLLLDVVAPEAAPCPEDMTWRWTAALVLLLAVLLFFVSVTVLHDILDGQSGRVEWRDKV